MQSPDHQPATTAGHSQANDRDRRKLLKATATGLGVAATAGISASATLGSNAALAHTNPNGRTFVLIHGAWHGAWCWRALTDTLLERGHRVWAPSLSGLADRAPLGAGQVVLDAGCGLGDGLLELSRAYPGVRLEGVEWSRPLAWWAALRVRAARVRQGDLWADDWSHFSLVYVFQRPESMPRVWAKACAEMPPGGWLCSLDFAVPDVKPAARWNLPTGQAVWLYRPVRNAAPKPA